MATEITPELRQAIIAADDVPVEIVDSQSQQHYVLLKAEFYERLKRVLDLSEPTDAEHTAMIQHMGKSAGWEDPSSDDLI